MDTQTARILVIDDDPMILGILRYILEYEQYEVLEARNGGEGIRLAETKQPDLILLDIHLPDIVGFEVCRELKANPDTNGISIIFLTAAEEDENECRSFHEGAVDFFRKPISRAQLCVRVKNALEIKSARERLERQTRELETMNSRLKDSLIMQEQIRRNLLQRDQVLCAVNYVAKSFLQACHWQEVIDDVLEYLGKTADCEHVYLRTFADEINGRQDYSWSAIHHSVRRSGLNVFSIDLLTAWQEPDMLLASGKPVIIPNNTLPPPLRQNFEHHGLRSCLLLPIYIRQDILRGCLGFDCGQSNRLREKSIVQAMMTSADIIGSAIQRDLESRDRMHLAAAINEFVDCVLMTDERGNIFYANPASRTVTGYRPSELIGCNFSSIQFDDSERISCGEILASAARDEEWCGEMRNHHKDGTLYNESVTVVPMKEEHGRAGGFCIIKRDQTEKRRLESIAEAANLMENVGFVFSGIRHELGNPLNSLKMALSVLLRQLDTISSDRIREFLERSMGEIKRMEYLLHVLKNFNLLEEQQPVPADLSAFLENFKRLHQNDLQQKDIRLDLISGKAVYGLVDERVLHQVMLNLLTNAISALKETANPAIFISLAGRNRHFIQIRFQDNGCGFSRQVKRQLFKPFFTTKINGTGLGLTIVKKMLTAMNCTITVGGKEEKGAWFIITIPAAKIGTEV